eukprot:6177747-Pleurochrysis_carterae.AAC.1
MCAPAHRRMYTRARARSPIRTEARARLFTSPASDALALVLSHAAYTHARVVSQPRSRRCSYSHSLSHGRIQF